MIDPKLDTLPVEQEGDFKGIERDPRRKTRGLSINDTIAAEASRSVGARGVDTSGVETGAVDRTGTATPEANSDAVTDVLEDEAVLDYHEVSARAYECWCERGCPDGSPETDWHQAVEELRNQRRPSKATAAIA